MEHQYPGAISGDEGMLAELMLPDQAHARKEDWTVFFLHKDTSEEEGEEADEADGEDNSKGGGAAREGADQGAIEPMSEANDESKLGTGMDVEEDDEVEEGEGTPLIYVLNLVNTKHDASAKRYALYFPPK